MKIFWPTLSLLQFTPGLASVICRAVILNPCFASFAEMVVGWSLAWMCIRNLAPVRRAERLVLAWRCGHADSCARARSVYP